MVYKIVTALWLLMKLLENEPHQKHDSLACAISCLKSPTGSFEIDKNPSGRCMLHLLYSFTAECPDYPLTTSHAVLLLVELGIFQEHPEIPSNASPAFLAVSTESTVEKSPPLDLLALPWLN